MRAKIFGFIGTGKCTTQGILVGLLKGYGGEVIVLDRDLRTWGAEYYDRIVLRTAPRGAENWQELPAGA